jgi:hypothetical protein
MIVDLMEITQVFGDIALKFSHHFFYVQDGTVILLVKEFNLLLKLIFWHHHIDTMHNSNKL